MVHLQENCRHSSLVGFVSRCEDCFMFSQHCLTLEFDVSFWVYGGYVRVDCLQQIVGFQMFCWLLSSC